MIESFDDPGRELSGTDAMEAMAKELPRVMAVKAAQQALERAGRSTLLRTTPASSSVRVEIGGDVYALVRLEDIDALDEALKALTKARAL